MILKNKNKKIIYVVIVGTVFVVAGLLVWFLHTRASATQMTGISENLKTIQIGNAVIHVELATTEAQWVQGLSGKISLPADGGMLFIFDRDSKWGIWMKDMNFPLDVLWMTSDMKISYIVEDMTPASYPQDYVPSAPVRYVLEIPAGTVKKYGMTVGQDVVIK